MTLSRISNPIVGFLICILPLVGCGSPRLRVGAITVPSDAMRGSSVLVFSKTAAFRHTSIETGIAAMEALGRDRGFGVTAREDASIFTDAGFAPFDLIVFLNTTGDVLDASQQDAMQRFVRSGKGYVGIHAAANTEYEWPWYGELVGAYFESHPQQQTATINILDAVHPSTSHLSERWTRFDEWYDFQTNPRGDVHVLATLDESTYSGGTMGHDHPFSWCQDFDGGRSFYTAGGHTDESYSESAFMAHVFRGMAWAAGAVGGNCGATVSANFQKTVLFDGTTNPMDLAVAEDGQVYFIERSGTIHSIDPRSLITTEIGSLDVFQGNEDGLIGMELDPSFSTTGWMYLFYSPPGDQAIQRISRFVMSAGRMDMQSETTILEFALQREECCHSAGSMAFDTEGNLYIATGDNTNPFDSNGYDPIDEQAGRSAWDAQKCSGNTGDLRGKILRVKPLEAGGYDIPSGNLFDGDPAARAPEIYAMGVRNPFRISVDPATDYLSWGDVGPDARTASEERGPAGLDEWHQARQAGNFGWPYCIGPNRPYVDYDFATESSKGSFDCLNLQNDSPNNTGALSLPPAQPAWIYYPYGESTEFPGVTAGGGRTAATGPVFWPSPSNGAFSLPDYYAGSLFIYEWTRHWIHHIKMDSSGGVLAILPFAGDIPLIRPIAMVLGPDGALYVIEWGTEFNGDNDDSQVVRIDFRPRTRAPIV